MDRSNNPREKLIVEQGSSRYTKKVRKSFYNKKNFISHKAYVNQEPGKDGRSIDTSKSSSSKATARAKSVKKNRDNDLTIDEDLSNDSDKEQVFHIEPNVFNKKTPDFNTIFIDGVVEAPKLVSSGAHSRIKSSMEIIQKPQLESTKDNIKNTSDALES